MIEDSIDNLIDWIDENIAALSARDEKLLRYQIEYFAQNITKPQDGIIQCILRRLIRTK